MRPYSLLRKFCRRCGVSNDRRDRRALYCFPCAALRDRDTGAYFAHCEVRKAVARGALPPAKTLRCVDCSGPARDYDHRDYNKPLEVQPVCRSCNKFRGPAIPLFRALVAAA